MPPGIVLDGIQVNLAGKPALQIEQITLSPDYLATVTGTPSILFKGALQSGSAAGSIQFAEEWRLPVIRSRFKAIDLEQLPLIAAVVPKRPVTGRISADCQIVLQPNASASAEVNAAITDATVGLLLPIGNIRSMAFDAIDLKATAKNDRVTISSCAWSSPLITGRLSGTISLTAPLGESTISLNGSIMPQQRLILELGEPLAARLFPGHRRRKNGYQITFTGTLEKPGFDIK